MGRICTDGGCPAEPSSRALPELRTPKQALLLRQAQGGGGPRSHAALLVSANAGQRHIFKFCRPGHPRKRKGNLGGFSGSWAPHILGKPTAALKLRREKVAPRRIGLRKAAYIRMKGEPTLRPSKPACRRFDEAGQELLEHHCLQTRAVFTANGCKWSRPPSLF